MFARGLQNVHIIDIEKNKTLKTLKNSDLSVKKEFYKMGLNMDKDFCQNILFDVYKEQEKCNYCKKDTCKICTKVKELSSKLKKDVSSSRIKMLKDGFFKKETTK